MLTAQELHDKYPSRSIDSIQAEIDRWLQLKETSPTRSEVDSLYDEAEVKRERMEALRGTPEEKMAAEEYWLANGNFAIKFDHWRFAKEGPQFVVSRSDCK